MGKGAGGCDDRPALSLGGAVLAEADPYTAAFNHIRAHRELYPLNDVLPMGSPCLPGVDSDRVRFRRMVKQLEGMGYVVASWEKSAKDPDISFSDGSWKGPHYTVDGTLQNYSGFRVTVKPLQTDSSEDPPVATPNTVAINDTQSALLENGFYAVVNFEHQLIKTGMVAHPSRMGKRPYDQDAPHPVEVLRAENGIVYRADGTEEEQEIAGDDALLARYAAFFRSKAFDDDNLTWARLPYELDEAEAWYEAGIDPGNVKQWMSAGFTAHDADVWADAGLASSEAKKATAYIKADISPATAFVFEAMQLSIADQGTHTTDQWKLLTKAVKRAQSQKQYDSEQLAYDLYVLHLEHQRWTAEGEMTQKEIDTEFKRVLAWSATGFKVYQKRHSWLANNDSYYDYLRPWNHWHGCSPTQAVLFQEAGFKRPEPGLTSAQVKQVMQWRAACKQLQEDGILQEDEYGRGLLNAKEALELCVRNVSPQQYVVMVEKLNGDYEDAQAALASGLSLEDIDTWKEYISLDQYADQYRNAGLFKEAGATIRQAIACHHADVSAQQFAAIVTA